MNDDLFGRDYEPEPAGRDNLFLWTVLILLLIGAALACWLGTFYIFGHPEKPDSYRILQKLHKLEPPRRFELTQAPPGEFLTPQKAFERYSTMSQFDLDHENESLLRDYINNFESTKRLVPYITGRYSIMNSVELKSGDFFGSGVVALAQSVDFDRVVIEHVYNAGPQAIPVLEQMLATGLDIKLEKTMDLSAIIHVERMKDGRIQLTVVPLLYGSYALKQGSGNFSLEPPDILNPAGGLPIIRGQLLADSLGSYKEFLRRRGGGQPIAAGATPVIPVAQSAAETTIVRVATPTPAPVTAETPQPQLPPKPFVTSETAETVQAAQSTPAPGVPAHTPAPGVTKPFLTPAPSASAVAAATPHPAPSVAAASPASSPQVSPTPGAIAAASPGKPLLQPFLVSSPTPGIATNTGASWKTYAPGQMPRGRLVTTAEVSDLAERGTGGERLYLRGNFVVTASGDNRVVLRSNSTFGSAIASVTNQPVTRVIVDFPAGTQTPSERTNVTRDEARPFEVRDVRRSPDGQVNIYVREITAAP